MALVIKRFEILRMTEVRNIPKTITIDYSYLLSFTIIECTLSEKNIMLGEISKGDRLPSFFWQKSSTLPILSCMPFQGASGL